MLKVYKRFLCNVYRRNARRNSRTKFQQKLWESFVYKMNISDSKTEKKERIRCSLLNYPRTYARIACVIVLVMCTFSTNVNDNED